MVRYIPKVNKAVKMLISQLPEFFHRQYIAKMGVDPHSLPVSILGFYRNTFITKADINIL
jgi:hypothetical protein